MKAVVMSVFGLIVSLSAAAAPVPATYALCKGKMFDGAPVSFVVRETAVVGLIQGLLEDPGAAVSMICQKSQTVDADRSGVFTCIENRSGDGKLIVNLERGISGHIIGQIYREQIFPLPAQAVGSLFCAH